MTHALQSYSEGRWQDGPGRAGGGEELGGLRAVRHYLERTAVQGHPDLLARLVPGGTQDPEEER